MEITTRMATTKVNRGSFLSVIQATAFGLTRFSNVARQTPKD